MTSTRLHAPLIIDTAAATLDAADRRRLAHPLVGGVILFARHWRDRARLAEQCAAIKAVREDLLICVDQEGGRVQTLHGDGFTRLPAMAALGRLWTRDPRAATDAARATGFVLASELRACGVDLSFTPVLDLDWGRSAVIGDRAFSGDPQVVAALAGALADGLADAGMRNCGKHFPGHGFAVADSHREVPVDERGRGEIERGDTVPYRLLAARLDAVMTAHVVYPAVDRRLASFSRTWLHDILRQGYGFQGCILSDDLGMAGARQLDARAVTYVEAATAALDAGCDLVLLCHKSQEDGGHAVDELIEGLEKARRNGSWRPSDASEARRARLLPDAPGPSWEDLARDPRHVQATRLPAFVEVDP